MNSVTKRGPALPGSIFARTAMLVIMIAAGLTNLFGQSVTKIRGKVTDAETGEAIPFANVYFHRDQSGTITDFDGIYNISTSYPEDSIEISYVGYKSQKKPIKQWVTQTIDFKLEPDVINLKELNVYAGENPSWQILRDVVKNSKENDKRALDAY